MTETCLIGLVGGLGSAATVHYYLGLLAECERRGLVARLVITHADVNRVLAAAANGDLKGMALYLAGRIGELDRAGVGVAAIAAVTPHMCLPELARLTPSPLIDVIDVLNKKLKDCGVERVALMGTRATVGGRLFGRLQATIVDPSPDQIARIHDLYVSIVQTGQVSSGLADTLGTLAKDLMQGLQVQAVILAGTELSLVPTRAWAGVRVVDCARLHIEAIVTAATLGHVEDPSQVLIQGSAAMCAAGTSERVVVSR